jgi:hypothetical protein
MPLETLVNVKSALVVNGTDDDSLLSQLQTVADAYVQTFCGRSFSAGPFTEFHSGAVKLAFLTNYPIAAILDLRVDSGREYEPDTIVPVERYVVHKSRGVIECLDGPFVPSLPGWDPPANAFPEAVRVVYTSATTIVPPLVSRGYTELIGHWFRQAKTHAATGQLNVIEQPGPDGTTVYPWSQSIGYSVPQGIKELLAPYRVPSL